MKSIDESKNECILVKFWQEFQANKKFSITSIYNRGPNLVEVAVCGVGKTEHCMVLLFLLD